MVIGGVLLTGVKGWPGPAAPVVLRARPAGAASPAGLSQGYEGRIRAQHCPARASLASSALRCRALPPAAGRSPKRWRPRRGRPRSWRKPRPYGRRRGGGRGSSAAAGRPHRRPPGSSPARQEVREGGRAVRAAGGVGGRRPGGDGLGPSCSGAADSAAERPFSRAAGAGPRGASRRPLDAASIAETSSSRREIVMALGDRGRHLVHSGPVQLGGPARTRALPAAELAELHGQQPVFHEPVQMERGRAPRQAQGAGSVVPADGVGRAGDEVEQPPAVLVAQRRDRRKPAGSTEVWS